MRSWGIGICRRCANHYTTDSWNSLSVLYTDTDINWSSPYDAKKQASEAPAGPVPTIKTSVDVTDAGLRWVPSPLASLMMAILSRIKSLEWEISTVLNETRERGTTFLSHDYVQLVILHNFNKRLRRFIMEFCIFQHMEHVVDPHRFQSQVLSFSNMWWNKAFRKSLNWSRLDYRVRHPEMDKIVWCAWLRSAPRQRADLIIILSDGVRETRKVSRQMRYKFSQYPPSAVHQRDHHDLLCVSPKLLGLYVKSPQDDVVCSRWSY